MSTKTRKNARRKSNRQPVSKELTKQAIYAKKHGLLSNRAKLGNGKLSRPVIRKLTALEELGAVPTYTFRERSTKAEILNAPTKIGIKLKPKMAKEAKIRGLEVFNNSTIVPKSEKKAAEKRISEGYLYGVERTAEREPGKREAVKTITRISLTKEDIGSFTDLFDAIDNGKLDLTKNDNEFFTFTFYDFHPNPNSQDAEGRRRHVAGAGGTFASGEELKQYILKYRSIFGAYEQGEDPSLFQHFELYKTAPGYTLGPTPEYVFRRDRARWITQQDRRNANRKYKLKQKHKMNQEEARRLANEKHKEYMQNKRKDPKFREQERQKDLERKRKIRNTKKPRV